MSDVAIIGATGNQGYGLALRWALAGKSITIGSRDQERAAAAAAKLRGVIVGAGKPEPEIVGLENGDAVAEAPVVVVSVPLAAQISTMKAIKDRIRPGTLLIDVTVPLATAIGGRASRMLSVPAGSAAEQLAEYAPAGVQVMSAFHFLSAELLAEIGPEGPLSLDCDALACGGDPAAQATVRELAEAIAGVRYLHVGPLVASRLVEAAATMLIAINIRHKRHSAGMRVTGIER
ncbi:MAG TPA: NADPH-dependent F420 reductase [Chloroflexota bacterium]|nr:NADPH-dependent F420 reductase [Chloroflexota bacterium]